MHRVHLAEPAPPSRRCRRGRASVRAVTSSAGQVAAVGDARRRRAAALSSTGSRCGARSGKSCPRTGSSMNRRDRARGRRSGSSRAAIQRAHRAGVWQVRCSCCAFRRVCARTRASTMRCARVSVTERVLGTRHGRVRLGIVEQLGDRLDDGHPRVRPDEPRDPASIASGRSVVSRRTRTGFPSAGASSWSPPESVSTRSQRVEDVHESRGSRAAL